MDDAQVRTAHNILESLKATAVVEISKLSAGPSQLAVLTCLAAEFSALTIKLLAHGVNLDETRILNYVNNTFQVELNRALGIHMQGSHKLHIALESLTPAQEAPKVIKKHMRLVKW